MHIYILTFLEFFWGQKYILILKFNPSGSYNLITPTKVGKRNVIQVHRCVPFYMTWTSTILPSWEET